MNLFVKKTWFGKLVGACCAISGVLIISLPIPIIVNTFNKLYEKAKIKNQIMKKKKMAGWQDFKKTGFQKPATFSISDPQDLGKFKSLVSLNLQNLFDQNILM